MLHSTRALRRASDAASARAALRSPLRAVTVAAAIVAGVAVSVAATSSSVAAAENPPVRGATGETGDGGGQQTSPMTGGVMSIVDRATDVLEKSQTAVAEARALKREVLASGLPVDREIVAIDTGRLQSAIDELQPDVLAPVLLLPSATADAAAATTEIAEDTDELRAAFQVAQERKAAEEAAAEAARIAEEQAAAQAAAEAAAAQAAANTPDGARATARELAASLYGWGSDQFSCLDSLWNKESNWNYEAYNPSGATGIPQALPGSKMASAGSDWQTNASTQVAWGLGYIADVYGTPCSAWSHSQATNWY